MRVVLLSDVFARSMGYLENILPKYLARQGIDVHVVAMDLLPYYFLPEFKQTYGNFSEQPCAGVVEGIDGYTLHILGHKRIAGYMRMVGLGGKLRALRPDIVQTTATIGWTPLDAAVYKLLLGYKLFTGSHTTASVFPLASQESSWWNRQRLRCALLRTFPGRLVSQLAERCYGATVDCADVAVRFFGVPKEKMDICPLGVDTELFSPATNGNDVRARSEFRRRLGFADSDIVCVYAGRFSEDKNPLLLARAVADLMFAGEPFRGFFLGNGVQAQAIEACQGCVTHPFIPVHQLANFFRACDIGVWPMQESTSMLDAAACGLPVIVNHTVAATERFEGNGLTYKLNDLEDLIRVLRIFREPETRERLGRCGARKMAQEFSWEAVARRRLLDYEAALHSGNMLTEKTVPERSV